MDGYKSKEKPAESLSVVSGATSVVSGLRSLSRFTIVSSIKQPKVKEESKGRCSLLKKLIVYFLILIAGFSLMGLIISAHTNANKGIFLTNKFFP